MKILRIRFKNLNSLEGEWEIDFTHPAFVANPIFAITGPTGSGKTTLLDAICLALYGRTPRLKIISKSVNEIMTRQTGECFAEVSFETLKGRYRCHWSQHRARKKPTGDLQQPRHEIVDHERKSVLENMIKKVAVKVEEVTGMTFDQFTRSILLAQGSFAAFLQASPDERAPLLEQLTGTEIYSRISQKVHEVTAQQEKTFTQLSDELMGLAILSQEEQDKLNHDLADKQNDARKQRLKLDDVIVNITWLEKLASLSREIQDLEDRHDAALEVKRGQETQRASLQRAKSASLYTTQLEYLSKMKKQQNEEFSTISSLQREEQSLQESITRLSEQVNKVAFSKEKIEEKFEKEREITSLVRTLDVQITDTESQLQQEENKASKVLQSIKERQQSLAELIEKRKEKERQLQKCQNYLVKQQTDGTLSENLPVLCEKKDHLQFAIDKQQKLENQLADIRKQKRNISKEVKRAHEHVEQASKYLLEVEERFTTVHQAGAAIRHDYPQLLQQLESTNQHLIQLEKLQIIHEEMGQTAAELATIHQLYQDFQNELQAAERKEREIEKDQRTLAQLISQQEEILMLARRVKNYEEERAALLPGSPCPLCGSTNHPYQDNEPYLESDATAKALANAKNKLIKLQADLVEAQTDRKFYRKRLEENRKTEEQLQLKHQKQQNSIVEYQDVFRATSPEHFEKELLENIEEKKHIKSELHQKYAELEKIDKEAAELRDQVERAKEEKISLLRTLEVEKHKQQQTIQKENNLQETSQILMEEVKQQFEALAEKLTPFGLHTVAIDELDPTMKKLRIRHEQWQQYKETENNLKEELQSTERDQHGLQVGVHSLEKELHLQQKTTAEIAQKLNSLRVKRREIYGEKNPDTEEQGLKQQLTQVSAELERLKEKRSQHESRIINLQAQLENLKQSTTKRAEQLQSEEESFTKNIEAQSFQDIEEFKEAILPEQHIIELESKFAKTDESIVRLATLLKEKQKDHRQEVAKQLTSASLEQLQQTQSDQTEELQHTLQEIGKIQGRLEENQKLLNQQQQKREALQTKKKEFERWQKLDWLIGSASGKKFRNFAQGMTFEIMVDHANKNLQKMTDRYILVRDQLQPLELNIIDNYRGGDIRTTQNLSGGESFLVSLALALGLSSMAGDSVRVDSFFLDEGFGTLDEETLDTALHTLAGLQQEGKMIGIISHVSLLKERLDTQIKLIPKTGGHSALKGPGIRAL